MKKLRITVEDKVYEVTVQVLEDDEQHYPGAAAALHPPGIAGSAVVVPQPLPPAGAPRPAVPSAQAHLPSPDADTVRSPIAGTVQKVFVAAGGQVEAKSPIALLDAMKMDTYIYAPRSGKVAVVSVAVGDSVQVGDTLVTFQPEA